MEVFNNLWLILDDYDVFIALFLNQQGLLGNPSSQEIPKLRKLSIKARCTNIFKLKLFINSVAQFLKQFYFLNPNEAHDHSLNSDEHCKQDKTKKKKYSFLMRASFVLGVSVVLIIFGYSSCEIEGNTIDIMEAEKWAAYKVS